MRLALGMLIPLALLSAGWDNCPKEGGNVKDNGEGTYTVVVKARLADEDLDAARQTHDEVAGGAKANAEELGDIRHAVMLGTEDPRAFLAMDVWTNLEGANRFFEDEEVGQALARVFEAPPEVAMYDRPEGYSTWGEFQVDDSTMVVLVEGTLVHATEQANLELHNQVAEGGREQAQALGDVAHLAYLDLQDRRRFLAIDCWNDPEGMSKFFSDPEIQAAFGTLFVEPPTITIWRTSDFLQW